MTSVFLELLPLVPGYEGCWAALPRCSSHEKVQNALPRSAPVSHRVHGGGRGLYSPATYQAGRVRVASSYRSTFQIRYSEGPFVLRQPDPTRQRDALEPSACRQPDCATPGPIIVEREPFYSDRKLGEKIPPPRIGAPAVGTGSTAPARPQTAAGRASTATPSGLNVPHYVPHSAGLSKNGVRSAPFCGVDPIMCINPII